MNLNLRDLKDLELQELSGQKSKAVIGGNTFGCIVGGILGLPTPFGVVAGCKIMSKVEDAIDYS